MIDGPAFTLALAAGLVAAVNPCGFAMLPAYLGFFLGRDGAEQSRTEAVIRAIPVATAVSAGFLAVFAAVGIALQPIKSNVLDVSPYASMAIGAGLIIFGVFTLLGRQPKLTLPVLNRGGRTRGTGSMFLYGVSYAIASLGCTLPIFSSAVVGTFSRESFLSGLAVMVAYGLGMSLVLIVLTLATALARDSVVRFLRGGMRYVERASGVLMILMGGYVVWYGIFSRRVKTDATTPAGPVDWVDRWSADANEFVHRIGAGRLTLTLLAVIGAIVCIAVIADQLRSGGRSRSS